MGNACGISTVKKIVTLGGRRHRHIIVTKPHKVKPPAITSEKTAIAKVKETDAETRREKNKQIRDNSLALVLSRRDAFCNTSNHAKSTHQQTDNTGPNPQIVTRQKNAQQAKRSTKRRRKTRNVIMCESSSSGFTSSFSNSSKSKLLNSRTRNKRRERTSEWQKEERRLQIEYENAEEKIRNSLRDEQRAKAEAQTWRARLERLTLEHRNQLFKQAQSLRCKLRKAEKLLSYHETREENLHDKNCKMKELIATVKEEARSLRVENEKKREATRKIFDKKFSTVEEQLMRLRQKVGEAKLPNVPETPASLGSFPPPLSNKTRAPKYPTAKQCRSNCSIHTTRNTNLLTCTSLCGNYSRHCSTNKHCGSTPSTSYNTANNQGACLNQTKQTTPCQHYDGHITSRGYSSRYAATGSSLASCATARLRANKDAKSPSNSNFPSRLIIFKPAHASPQKPQTDSSSRTWTTTVKHRTQSNRSPRQPTVVLCRKQPNNCDAKSSVISAYSNILAMAGNDRRTFGYKPLTTSANSNNWPQKADNYEPGNLTDDFSSRNVISTSSDCKINNQLGKNVITSSSTPINFNGNVQNVRNNSTGNNPRNYNRFSPANSPYSPISEDIAYPANQDGGFSSSAGSSVLMRLSGGRTTNGSSLVSPNSVKLVNDFEDVTSLYTDVIKKDLDAASPIKREIAAGNGAYRAYQNF